MSVKYFIDTNVFVYCYDGVQPAKKERALALISDALQNGNGMISWQVIQEFLNVATRKFAVPIKVEDATLYLQKVLSPLCRIHPNSEIYPQSLEIMKENKYSFYDSLILAAALQGECSVIYTEDMKHGQEIRTMRIVNPFFE
ncbi:MAG: PIN domain-containing protein [Chloroflexi bacterium]|nr:PIN domain-containing protein [Chloroflexota bacterium]